MAQVNQDHSYLSQVNRGGLTTPSEMSFLSCLHVWAFYKKIVENEVSSKILLSSNVPSRKVFLLSFSNYLQSSDETRLTFFEQCCEEGHQFKKKLYLFASKCFNIFSKNYVAKIHSSIHENRKRSSYPDIKRDATNFKSKKLQSDKIQ